jgi:argininosuccinate synthase
MTGSITLKLYKGNMIVVSRSSPNSLYSESIATMEGGEEDYNQTDAQGFLRINSLPIRVQAKSRTRSY